MYCNKYCTGEKNLATLNMLIQDLKLLLYILVNIASTKKNKNLVKNGLETLRFQSTEP